MDVYWSEERLRIKEWLGATAPALSGIYELVIGLVYGSLQTISTGQMAAHGMREIMNSMPEYFASEAFIRGRADYPMHCDRITPPWRLANLPVGTEPAPVPLTQAPSIDAPVVPQELVFKIGYLIHVHEMASNRKRLNRVALFKSLNENFSTSVELLQPIMDEWDALAEWFADNCHVNRKNFVPVEIDELKKKIEGLENILSVMSDNFFNIMEDLDADIQQANS